MSIFSSYIKHRKLMKDPVSYWKMKGVNFPKGGDGCEIYPSVDFGSEPYLVTIGNNVRINQKVTIVTHDGGVWVLRNMNEQYKDIDMFGPVVIDDNVHIGTSAIIMPGVHIGKNCIIGCGAVVTKDIEDNSIAVGIPARIIKTIYDYESQHKHDFVHTKSLNFEEKKRAILEMFNK